MLTRRAILAGAGASLIMPHSLRASVTMGEITLTSVSDGNLVLPGDFSFSGLPEEELTPLLAKHAISRDQVTPPCNLTLMQDGTHTVLFDAGSGPGFMASAGRISDALDAEGLTPDDITHVVFTHAHPDHLWGVLDDFDDLLFPEALYMIGEAEWAYWTDPDTVNTIGEERASFAVGAQRRLEAIADRTTFLKGGDDVLPGVMAHETFGHTPGHLSFEVHGGGQSTMIIGDAIVNGHIAMERPDWPSGSDDDAETGIATRQRLLDQLTTEQMRVIGFHFPGKGVGFIEQAGDSFRFVEEG